MDLALQRSGEFTPYLQALGAYEDAIGRMIEKAMDAVLAARMGRDTAVSMGALSSIHKDPRYGEVWQTLIRLCDKNMISS